MPLSKIARIARSVKAGKASWKKGPKAHFTKARRDALSKARAARASVKKGAGPSGLKAKKRDAAWSAFEKTARKELGAGWKGNVTGDMLYGGQLSKKARDLYSKYFNLI